jgi:hypothetical protein
MKRFALPLAIALALPAAAAAHGDKEKHPSISLKANPAMAFSPAHVVLTADLKGGANDDEAFYCPTVEWDWGDGTVSDDSADCDPYQPGKSEIKRHFTVDRVFPNAGEFRIQFRLKKKDKIIATASTLIRVRSGIGDGGGE